MKKMPCSFYAELPSDIASNASELICLKLGFFIASSVIIDASSGIRS
jgi:hypothetical protein